MSSHIYHNDDIPIIILADGSGWWSWDQVVDAGLNTAIGTTDFTPSANAKLTVYKYDSEQNDYVVMKEITGETSGDSGVILEMKDFFVLGCSYGTGLDTISNPGKILLKSVALMWCVQKAPFGKYKIVVELNIASEGGESHKFTLISIFTVRPKNNKHKPHIQMKAKLTLTPTCVCYLNNEGSTKTISFNYTVTDFQIYTNGNIPIFVVPGYNPLVENTRFYLRLKDKNDNTLTEIDITECNNGTVSYTFDLPEDSKWEGKWVLVGVLDGTEYELDSQEIIILRQKYCHSIKIDVKMYDKKGNEIQDKIPHPTSADWSEEQYGEIKVKIVITDEQARYVDVPIDKLKTNWQYTLTQTGTGQFEFTIPNTADSALGLGDYGIAVYVDKCWCDTNGYLNSYNIKAEDVIINNNMIEKVMYIGAEVDHYENGITYLNNTYETLTGIFVNAQKEFKVVQQMQEATQQNQYTFCYTPFISSQTLNLPTYTDEEKKKLARAIVRALGRPRKKETFTILDKELPKLNQVITLNINGQLRTVPIYALKISIAHKLLSIMISNDEEKLLKDYLSMIK